MNKQRGELSLVWCAILVGLLAFAMMAGLFAMRYQRNLFAETWSNLMRSYSGQTLQRTQSAAESTGKPDLTAMRKCKVDGKLVYSNVECGADNPTSLSVELHDSRGIEPPKTEPDVAAAGATPVDLKSRMIEPVIPR